MRNTRTGNGTENSGSIDIVLDYQAGDQIEICISDKAGRQLVNTMQLEDGVYEFL